MRILQVTDCYPPPVLGGRDLHVQMLAHELSQRGHDVEVVSLGGPSGARIELDGDIPVHRVVGWSRVLNRFYADPERPFHPTVPDPGIVRALLDLIEARQPHVVHVHSWMLYSLLPFLPSVKTRLIVTMHEYGIACAKNTFVRKGEMCNGPGITKCIACASDQYGLVRSTALTAGLRVSRHMLPRVNCFIAVSDSVLQGFKSLAMKYSGRIEVVPPFIPDKCFQSPDKQRPNFLPPTGEFIMFAGALGPHKGIDVLLEAFQGLDSDIPLVLLGLQRHDSPKRLPDRVILVENVPHDDVINAWNCCAIAVVPSRWPEPLGMVALEAMAAGRPVVASAVGGLQAVVEDGVTGIHVPAGDVRALRAGIQRLINDPFERSQMGEAGRVRASNYSASSVVPRLEEIYDGVANSLTIDQNP